MKRGAPACLLAAALFLAACDSGTPDDGDFTVRRPRATPAESDSLLIGLVGTMSGPDQWRGNNAFEGADLAVHMLNRGDGPTIELITLDDAGDAERATANVEDLARSERTIGIVYAGPPAGLPPAERALADAGIPAVLCYGDLYSIRRLTPHVFQSAPALLWEARRLEAYIARDRGYLSVGMLSERTPAGWNARRAVRAEFPRRGPLKLRSVKYPAGTTDFREFLERLGRTQVEAVIVQGDSRQFHAVASALEELGASYSGTGQARVASLTRKKLRKERRAEGWWHPQLFGFDAAFGPVPEDASLQPGTVVAETYGRGAHYLPIPELRAFRSAFSNWWNEPPLGWQQRAYEATRLIGWAAERSEEGDDLALKLEAARNVRFGGGLITLGPDDHTLVTQPHVGLWTIPRAADRFARASSLPESFPWVPLSRGFSIDGETTDIPNVEWKHLFRDPPPPGGRAPGIRRFRFAISTPRSDKLH